MNDIIGYVYEITGGGNRYVGSTYHDPRMRLTSHKSAMRQHQRGLCSFRPIFNILSCDDVIIRTLETIQSQQPDPVLLRSRERHYIETLPCVNKNLPNNAALCAHGKRVAICVDCRGTHICPHNKLKYQCTQCVGSNVCEHLKQRNQCKTCMPRVCDICHKVLGSIHGLSEHKKRHHQPILIPIRNDIDPPNDIVNIFNQIAIDVR